MEFFRLLVQGAATFVGLGCAAAALAAHGGRWSARFDLLTHFAPLWLVGGLAVAAYGLGLTEAGPRRGLLAIGLTGAVLAALLIAPEYLRATAAKASSGAPSQIKLIQFNAWGRNRDPDATVAWLAAQDADIIVLQEAELIAGALRRKTGYHLVPGADRLAILSKARPIAADVSMPADRWATPPLAGATFADSDGRFTVIGVHYIWPTYGGFQQAQGRVVSELIGRFPKNRLILTGDFNSTPWSFSRRREDMRFGLERRTRGLFTWPAGQVSRHRIGFPFPFLPIDHVYAGPGWRTVKVERGPRLGSDHYPVVVILAASD